MYSNRPSRTNSLLKTASFVLAVLFFAYTLLTDIAHGSAQENTPWIYDTARISSQSSVSGQYGDYKESYEISLPQGINGLTPSLQLSYSSQNENLDSLVGYGWQLSIPTIVRINKNGTNVLYNRDDYASSLDGEITKINANSYKPVVEGGNFSTYFKNNDVWTTFSTEGTKYTFGSTSSERLNNISSTTQIYAWQLNTIEDKNGNKVNYQYLKDENYIYPSKILYGYTNQTTPSYEVRFVYSSTTPNVSFATGFSVTNRNILEAIEVYLNNTLVIKYDLNYNNAVSSNIRLLKDIQKIGYDSNGFAASASPKYFEYNFATSTSWSSNSSIATTVPSILLLAVTETGQNYTQYSRDTLIDMNGDGLTDWVEGGKVYLNTGSGWQATSSWPTLPITNFHLENRLADVNGDLLPDIIISRKESFDPSFNTPTIYNKSIKINQGDGTWVDNQSWANTIPSDFYWKFWMGGGGITIVKYNVYFTDMNGDGLSDWLTDGLVYLNNGSGWASTTTWAQLPSGTSSFDDKWRLADVNSDSLPDLIMSEKYTFDDQWNQSPYGNYLIKLNRGDGTWQDSTSWSDSIPRGAEAYWKHQSYPGGQQTFNQKVYLADVNGDNLSDWLFNTTAYLNTGTGWSTTSVVTLPISTEELVKSYRLEDIDGDNQLDFVRYYLRHFFGTQTHTKEALVNNNEKIWQLSTTTNENGGITSITYDVTTGKESNTLLNPNSPVVKDVVKKVIKNSVNGTSATSEFTHRGGDLYHDSADIFNRRFAGFNQVTETNASNKTNIFYHQGNNNSTSSEETNDTYAKIGLPYRSEIFDLNSNLYDLSITKYDVYNLATSSNFVKKSRETLLSYDGDGDHRDSATEYTYSNSTGLLTSKLDLGRVTANNDGTYTDVTGDKTTTDYEYASSTSNNILGLLSKQTVKDEANVKIQESRYYYDSQALHSVTKGNLTKEENLISGSSYASTTRAYNSFGLVTSETNPRGKTTTYAYDSYNLYPATSTNALSQATKFEYDYSSGKVATTTDPNGEKFVTIYDGLDRPLAEKVPDAQSGALVTKNAYVYNDTPGNLYVKQTANLNSATTTTAYTYLDGFGRKIQERTEMEDSNTFSVRDYIYGTNGLLLKESLPYTSTGASSTAATSNQNLYTTYAYDALNRIISATTVLGTTATDRDQWTETVTDALGNEKDYVYDAYGRLIQVKENNGTSTYTTTYAWNHLNNLTKVTDALGNVRNITYDNLGRRLTLEDLHGATDTTFGTWSYTYDLAGNLATTTNPKGQITGYTYDNLNRPLTENFTGQTGIEVSYTYDSCTKGIGRLCTAINSGATTTLAYNRLGQTATETRAISGTSYTTKYEYDRLGNKTRIIYPDNSEVTYTYNKANRVEVVRQKESGGTFKTIIGDIDYGPHGLVTYQLYGNGASTTKTYNANALYRLTNITTTATSSYGIGGAGDELRLLEEALFAPIEENLMNAVVEEPILVLDEPATTTNEVISEPLQDNEATTTESEVASSTTAEIAPEIVTEESTTTTPISEEVVFDIPAITDEIILDGSQVLASTSQTTPLIPLEVLKEKKVKKLDTKNFIKNVHDAKVWQKYHKERVRGIERELGIDSAVYKAAVLTQTNFEDRLIDEKYLKEKGAEVDGGNLDWVKKGMQKSFEEILSYILPQTVYAYVFGTEDFESCTTLPCSFNNNVSWGSVTPTLDATSKVTGVDSLRESVTGEGGGAMEYINLNEDEIYAKFSIFIPSNMTWGASGYFSTLQFEDSNNNLVFWISIEDWGSARMTINGDVLPWTDTGLDLVKGAVNTIQVRFKKGTTNGDVDIWLNNDTENSPNYNGSGSLNTGTDNVDDMLTGISYAPETISTTYFDDISIDTSFIGEPGGEPNTPVVDVIQNLTYTYDLVGNITQITDTSKTLNQSIVSYQYDDLYRLTRASTTQASSTPFTQTYAYDPIGNITSKSDLGAYTYAGSSGGSSNITHTIYGDSLAANWDNWSWGGTYNLSSTAPVGSGTYSLKATYTSQYGGLQLRNGTVNTTDYDSVDFKIYVESGSSISLWARILNKDTNAEIGKVQVKNYLPGGVYTLGQWYDVSIPLSHLNFENFSGNAALVFQSDGQPTVVINYDDIKLVGTTSGSGPSYANPHAVTTIGSTGYNYDLNGNLASTTLGLSNTWSYNNYLLSSMGGGTASSTYLYDHSGLRTMKVSGGISTRYPNQWYEAKGSTTTKQVYVGSEVVASIESDTPAPSVYYNHLDHLGSTQVVSGEDGYITQELSYYPFGDLRIDNQYSSIDTSKKFTGFELDRETDLNYAGARYYAADRGQFISQDPVFQALGDTRLLEEKTNIPFETYLANPQTHNSYSYAANNPIKYVDKSGEFLQYAIALFLPNVAYAPGVGEEEYTSQGLEGSIAVAGVVSPSSKVSGAARLLENQAKGRAGEIASGIVKNSEKIQSLTKPGTSRIPDVLDHSSKIIGDVKNVNYQSFTSQLKDFASYAQTNSYKFVLTVDQRTQLSKTIQQLSKQIEVVRKNLNKKNN